MEQTTEVQVNRNYKDTLFRLIFKEKENLLSLYNAMTGSTYTNVEDLEIITLENAIYMNMKNDLAFLIDSTVNLYEHQSTYSPNMPLRNLFYIAREWEMLVSQKTLYSSKLVKIPTPNFIVFYNGQDHEWLQEQLRLSDAYEKPMELPNLELLVTVVNINYGRNGALFEKCPILKEYALYVDKVRKYNADMEIHQAVERAIEECIQEGILKDLLSRYRSEAVQMSIFEFDEEKEMRLIRADEREIGREEGIRNFIQDNLEENISESRIVEKLGRRFGFTQVQAEEWIQREKECLV